jgi:hypothetical protein
MISDFKQIEELFEETDQQLTSNINIYIIGGIVLLCQGLKPATKDIDVILPNKESYSALLKALTSLGFKRKEPTEICKKMEINVILEKGDFRFDLFLQKVCKKISLTNEMKNRAIHILTMKHLNVFLCPNEDIFIFKSMTERKGDLEDCITLAKRGINWDIILKEIQSQIKHSGEDVWITWIGERLDLLEDEGINIPIMKEINELRDNYFERIEKNFKQKQRTKKSNQRA